VSQFPFVRKAVAIEVVIGCGNDEIAERLRGLCVGAGLIDKGDLICGEFSMPKSDVVQLPVPLTFRSFGVVSNPERVSAIIKGRSSGCAIGV